MKNSNITMDTLLRFLDSEKVSLATFVAGQNGPWLEEAIASNAARARQRINALAGAVRRNCGRSRDRFVRTKGEAVVAALEATEFPDCPLKDLPAGVTGRWHSEVVVEEKGARFGTKRRVKIGTADYVMTVQMKSLNLSTFDFEDGLGVAGFPISDPDDESLLQEQEFLNWLAGISLSQCSCSEGKRWEISACGRETLYFVCLPSITSLSDDVKRLRKFEEALPRGRVYVCLADPEEAKTLNEQGFGTLVFPSGERFGWTLRPIQSEASERYSFGPAWANVQAG